MITNRILLCCTCAALMIVAASGQTITVSSDPFTFPAITAIKASSKPVNATASFSCLNASTRLAGVKFAWSFPQQTQRLKGSIMIYSPQGQAVKRISVSSNSGIVAWNGAKESAVGVYIAKVSYGSSRQTLKFIISK
ncbi:MAG TPA: T9SS type A sorting domain-containing protein [Chitinivibrionales bacterium]